MRSMVCLLAVVALLAGCATHKPDHSQDKNSARDKQSVVTQTTVLIGKVVSVKADLGFAVLNFPVGSLPAMDQSLNVYRNGTKVGIVKVTGPRQDDNIVGDITSGEVLAGDQVRDD